MIEPILYVALGFLSGSLLALFFGRAVWNRAVRLTTDRIMRKLPISRVEITAQQDLVRAEAAVAQRALERRATVLEGRVAKAMADAGRLEGTLAHTSAELEQTKAARDMHAAAEKALREETSRISAELGATKKSLAVTQKTAAELKEALDRTEREKNELGILADERAIEIAAFSAQLEQLRGLTSQLEKEVAGQRRTMADAAERAAFATEQLANERNRAEMLADKLRATEAELAAVRARADAMPAAPDEREIERLKAEKAALEGALTQARAERLSPTSAQELAELDLLRRRIEDLAGEMARQAGVKLPPATSAAE